MYDIVMNILENCVPIILPLAALRFLLDYIRSWLFKDV